jgi:Zn-dependent peptidase ImmA (M78 family)
VAALGLLAAGCVTLTPPQQARVAEVQRFADATADAYGVSRIRLTIEPANNLGLGARYRQGNFYLNVGMLGSAHLEAIVAHELGHYLLGHDTLASGVVTQADWQRAQEELELDANAKAVEILVRARGLTRAEAVQVMVRFLQTAQRAIDAGGALAPGHRQPAAEIADLLARFPDAR